MIRVRTLFVTILPSMIAGGLLFGSARGHAEAGSGGALGASPPGPDAATGLVRLAQADPWPRSRSRGPMPPMPPMPPTWAMPPGAPPGPPTPPVPPHHGHGHGHGRGMSVSIHDGKIEIDGIEEMVQDQLERVAEVLDSLPDVPPEVRERALGRVKAVRAKLGARLSKLKSLDLDKIGPEMERMGDEIEKEMEGLDKDLAQFGDKLGEKFGKNFGEKFGKNFAKSFLPGHNPHGYDRDNSDDGDDDADDDDDDKDATALPPNAESDMADPSDMRAAIADLKDLALDQNQKDQLAKLRADSDHQVAEAQRELEGMSDRLHEALGDAGASEADIARQIDMISAKEATIRKARILAWVKARSLLDKDQRKKVEAAAGKRQ